MKVHHLNCGTMCPYARRWVEGEGSLFARGRAVCHCLLVEATSGLVLVETGLGTEDLARTRRDLGWMFLGLTQPRLDPAETAVAQVRRLGFSAKDVRHIVLTHGHCDHAGGLSDFPDATIHLLADEHRSMTDPSTRFERYVYRRRQWAHRPLWMPHALQGDRWNGFAAVRALPGVQPEILLLPLPGHTRGHAAVVVQTEDRILFHAGDLYAHRDQLDPARGKPPPALRWFQQLVDFDGGSREQNLFRLRELKQQSGSAIDIFCAHDPVEFERMVDHTRPATANLAGIGPKA